MIPQQGARTVRCPKCESALEVVDSRPAKFMGAPSVRRRRACTSPACGHRFTTFELSTEMLESSFEQFAAVLDASACSLQDSLKKLRTILNDR